MKDIIIIAFAIFAFSLPILYLIKSIYIAFKPWRDNIKQREKWLNENKKK